MPVGRMKKPHKNAPLSSTILSIEASSPEYLRTDTARLRITVHFQADSIIISDIAKRKPIKREANLSQRVKQLTVSTLAAGSQLRLHRLLYLAISRTSA